MSCGVPGVPERKHFDVALMTFGVAELQGGNVEGRGGGVERQIGHVSDERRWCVGWWWPWEHERDNAIMAGNYMAAVVVVVVIVVEGAISTSTDTVAPLQSYIAPNNVEEPTKSLGKTCVH